MVLQTFLRGALPPLSHEVNTQRKGSKGERRERERAGGNAFFFTFLSPGGGFKELDSQFLDGEHSGVSLLLPLLVLSPQALHATRTQALRLQGDLGVVGGSTLVRLGLVDGALTLHGSWLAQISTLKSHPAILPTSNGNDFQSVLIFYEFPKAISSF